MSDSEQKEPRTAHEVRTAIIAAMDGASSHSDLISRLMPIAYPLDSGYISPPMLKIVKLPDGRWATENGEGVGDLTPPDIEQMYQAFMLWADIQWRRKRD